MLVFLLYMGLKIVQIKYNLTVNDMWYVVLRFCDRKVKEVNLRAYSWRATSAEEPRDQLAPGRGWKLRSSWTHSPCGSCSLDTKIVCMNQCKNHESSHVFVYFFMNHCRYMNQGTLMENICSRIISMSTLVDLRFHSIFNKLINTLAIHSRAASQLQLILHSSLPQPNNIMKGRDRHWILL